MPLKKELKKTPKQTRTLFQLSPCNSVHQGYHINPLRNLSRAILYWVYMGVLQV